MKQTGEALLNRFKKQLTQDEQIELSTLMMFSIIQLDILARELRDNTSKEQKREINMFLNMSKRIVKRIEKKYIDDADEELEEIYYQVQDFILKTTKHQMNALRNNKTEQFLESVKFI